MQNLRDKLLKAGLVTEDQAKKVTSEAPKRPPANAAPPRSEARPPPRRDDARPSRPRPHPAEARGLQRRTEARGPHRPVPAVAERAVPKLPPLPGSKAHQRIESRKQQEQDRQLRELVLTHQVPLDVGATAFYFMTRKGKLRRLELTEAQAKLLETGALAVVERPEPAQIEHSLVPGEVAEKMHALSQKSVRFLNRPHAPIGFMNDDEVKAQQKKEAAGEVPDVPDEPPADLENEPPAEAASPEEGPAS